MKITINRNGTFQIVGVVRLEGSLSDMSTEVKEVNDGEGCDTSYSAHDVLPNSAGECKTAAEAVDLLRRVHQEFARKIEVHNATVRRLRRDLVIAQYNGPLYGKDAQGKFITLD
jgi:hypothetical protein